MRKDISEKELFVVINRLERMADLTDSKFKIPGTNIPIGLDAIIGFIPIVGEFIGLLMSLYIFSQAQKIHLPLRLKIKMLLNIAIDFAIGFIPVIGDIADIGFRSNIRNIKIILTHIESERAIQKQIELQTEKSYLGILFLTLLVVSAFALTYFILVSL